MYMLHLTRMEEYTDNENNIFKEIKDMSRKKIIAGNWKMNMTPSQAVKLVEELKPLVVSDDVEVVYCVPAIDIVPVVEACLLYTSPSPRD